MTFYSNLAATALRLLTSYGAPVTLRSFSVGGGDYNPDTLSATPLGITGAYDQTRVALLADAPATSLRKNFGQTLQNGTMIQGSDKWIYLDANGRVPTLQDHLIVQNVEYSIVDIQVIGPGGVDLLYLLVLRS